MPRPIFAASLLALSAAACRDTPEPSPSPSAPPAASSGAPATAGAGDAEAPEPSPAPRRERAGLETGEPAEAAAAADPSAVVGRPPAAELIPPPAAAADEAPPLRTGPEADLAKAALAFLRGTWREAAAKGALEGYGALLDPDFKGVPNDGKEPPVVPAAAWPSRRRPPLGSEVDLALGAPEVMVQLEPEARATLRFHERSRPGAGGCVELDRELTAVRPSGGAFRLVTEAELGVSECLDPDPAEVAGAHERLRRALAAGDLRAIGDLVGAAGWVRDHGLEVGRFGARDLAAGSFAWIGAALRAVEPDSEHTRVAGAEGHVSSPDGSLTFVYAAPRAAGKPWQLAGVLRE